MTLVQRLENVGVIGAAGKMGSGIVLLLAQEMAKLKIKNPDRGYYLYAMDVSEKALDGLMLYLRAQATKAAEKGCVALRDLYRDRNDLVENYDIIAQFTNDVLSVIRPTTDLGSLRQAHMIFEAIVENEQIKIDVLKTLNKQCSSGTYYFSNTSSIPIHVLDDGVGLEGRIIGYHFYNPPAVQKLAELITSSNTRQDVIDVSHEIAKLLKKIIIPSNDIAGFIGNGHFMRDIIHATEEVNRLSDSFSQIEGIYALNKVSQDFLIRPMGIFQLIDYVGVEVCQLIMQVMTRYTDGLTLESTLLNRMVDAGVIGGQYADGSQKDGFLKYEKNRPAGVYDLEKGNYVPFGDWSKQVDEKLGALPDGWAPWRSLLVDSKRHEKLKVIFSNLNQMKTFGADLARAYFQKSKAIGEGLISDGVAANAEDVNGVLINGFFHLYGPINDYIA